MKKFLRHIFVFVVCLSIALICFVGLNVFAATDPLVVDDANLLTEDEEYALSEKLYSVSENIECDIVVVTVDSMNGKSPQDFADDYMDYNGYGYNGGEDCVLLAVCIGSREYHFSTRGFAIKAFNDDAVTDMEISLESYLTEDEYYDAFMEFVDLTEEFVVSARNGDPYKSDFSVVTNIFVALIVGFLIAFTSVSVMKGQLKTVRSQYTATGYEKKGSMKVTNSRDLYLYRTVTKTVRPKNNSSGGSHTSSSGRSHGGGGGRF